MITSEKAAFPFRFQQYLRERFPSANAVGAIVLAISMASAVSGVVVGVRPEDLPLAASVLVGIGMFLILRICDEFKDAEEDRLHRPERPVPRGLVSLEELRGVAIGIGILQAVLVVLLAPDAWWLLVATSVWIGLMTIEFGVGAWLKQHSIVYLLSHMVAMPLIALLGMAVATSVDVVQHPAAWHLACIAFLCGIVLEIGRKIWDVEREGVETYASIWGRDNAVMVWQAAIMMLLLLATPFGDHLRYPSPLLDLIFVMSLGAIGLTLFNLALYVTGRDPWMPQKLVSTLSAVVVLLVLVCIGAAPWVN